jgi:DNA polymerase elongation subunit (family B)
MHRTSHYAQEALFDRDTMTGVVAIEPVGHFFRVFRRYNNEVTFHDLPFRPFFLTTTPTLADTSPVQTTQLQLEGSGALQWLLTVKDWHDWSLLRNHLQQFCNPREWFSIHDSRQQFLVTSGITFFKGLDCSEVTFICLAVTTRSGNQGVDTPNDEPLVSIAVTDGNGYKASITSENFSELQMLEQLSAIIRDKNPDVITGYNLTGQDLPYLIKRANIHGIKLEWGRNGTALHITSHRNKLVFYEAYGRSIVDVRTFVRYYHQQIHPLPGTGIHQTAAWFCCTSAAGANQTQARNDADCCARLYTLLAPVWHLQAQLYPVSFQSVSADRSRGSAVQALMTREYLLQQHALPSTPDTPVTSLQEQCQVTRTGHFRPLVYCDLSFLAGSIMLSYQIKSRGDDLSLMLPLLRLIMQASLTIATDTNQPYPINLYHLLIYPWQELLASTHLPFSDFTAAHELHRLECVLQNDLLNWLSDKKTVPVVLDRQGIYFVPPDGHNGTEEVAELVQQLSSLVPKGIALKLDRQYLAMLVYSKNTYALLEQSGKMVVRGSSFTSRSMEPFLREFLLEATRLLLLDQPGEVQRLYETFIRRLAAHDCPVHWVMRTETLTDTLANYLYAVQTGKRKRAAAYELALTAPDRWQSGDKIRYYVTGNSKNIAIHDHCRLIQDFNPAHQDMNIPWYTEKLYLLYKKLTPFIPSEPLLWP